MRIVTIVNDVIREIARQLSGQYESLAEQSVAIDSGPPGGRVAA